MPYNVYVIELDPRVLERQKFRDANPGHVTGKPCVYVGQTYLSPEERFEQHSAGVHSNKYVRHFGVRLRPRFYLKYQGLETREQAEQAEAELGERLRRRGFAVWWG